MIIDCLSKAIFLYVIYNIVVLMLFGVPKSLSMTYYLFKERKDNLKVIFPAMIILLVIFMIPCWLTLSEGSPFQFMSFISCASLIFVGMSPAFERTKLESNVHNYGAYLACAAALAWIFLVTPYWWIPIINLVIFGIIALVTRTYKSGLIYWLENATIISTFSAMLAYFEHIVKFI